MDDELKEITVADPSRKLRSIQLSVSCRIIETGDDFKAVWNKQGAYSEISVDLSQNVQAGKSVTVAFD
jgi:hypothetical protein